jgi:predicted MPP superfamily phosphohydrolase
VISVVGLPRTLAVRTERVATRGRAAARLLYASDLHLGWPWTRSVPELLLNAVERLRPDALLLGGDLCDGLASVSDLADLVRRAAESTVVAAVPGNHDARTGARAIRDAVRAAGGAWLPDAPWSAGGVRVEGWARTGPSDAVRVLCAHAPSVTPAARATGFDVVLAGHLHGGQLVLFESGGRLYPYAWIDRWNGLRFDLPGTTLVVSRGVADALPLRVRCPREVVLCELY